MTSCILTAFVSMATRCQIPLNIVHISVTAIGYFGTISVTIFTETPPKLVGVTETLRNSRKRKPTVAMSVLGLRRHMDYPTWTSLPQN